MLRILLLLLLQFAIRMIPLESMIRSNEQHSSTDMRASVKTDFNTESFHWKLSQANYPSGQPSGQPTQQPTTQPTIAPTSDPTSQPSYSPSSQPSEVPTKQPSLQPSSSPSTLPSGLPSSQPTSFPTIHPSRIPTTQPSQRPTSVPSFSPSAQPTLQPSSDPTSQPSVQPSSRPSVCPTIQPSAYPTALPTTQPTHHPTGQPTFFPSAYPTAQPSSDPSTQPSYSPSSEPSQQPSVTPSSNPTSQPTCIPTSLPSAIPSSAPSTQPSSLPTGQPSNTPSGMPSRQPIGSPTAFPSSQPSIQPSAVPSSDPTSQPSIEPSLTPTSSPTLQPSSFPSCKPTAQPSSSPSIQPSNTPTTQPSYQPFMNPSGVPTSQPSSLPTSTPSKVPTSQPTLRPSSSPSAQPYSVPTRSPSGQPTCTPTLEPSSQPSMQPTFQPVSAPSRSPSTQPTSIPSIPPSSLPTRFPTVQPSGIPSAQPTVNPSSDPTSQPTISPTLQPSIQPTATPSRQPFSSPSALPSSQPTSQPTGDPTASPTGQPTLQPSCQPSVMPSTQPTNYPTTQPFSSPSSQPSTQPSCSPSAQPLAFPSTQPSSQPSVAPTTQPSMQPSSRPSTQPSNLPTSQPSSVPTILPTSQPSCKPSLQPSQQPTNTPSLQPSSAPSRQPSSQPTTVPSCTPTRQPSALPSGQPTSIPSLQPTMQPSSQPSDAPTVIPSQQPSSVPSTQPTSQPSSLPTQPTSQPSMQPSSQPTSLPSSLPTTQPSSIPTTQPTNQPTCQPSTQPSSAPSRQPSTQPSSLPNRQPSYQPTRQPSGQPSSYPTMQPSRQPSSQPSEQPSDEPSSQPTTQPSALPTVQPTSYPSAQPTTQPTVQPTVSPTQQPSSAPSVQPSGQPTADPSGQPSASPTVTPSSQPSRVPSMQPTREPSMQPSSRPTIQPSSQPSIVPSSQPTIQPTSQPSIQPSTQPSGEPTGQPTSQPTCQPSIQPSSQPSHQPSMQPSKQPTSQPSCQPTSQPTNPTTQPTTQPTDQPTSEPTMQPTVQPTLQPSALPSMQPSGLPTMQPSAQPSIRPSRQPSTQPTTQPSFQPSIQPSQQPSTQPSSMPSMQPTVQPSTQPSNTPSCQPSRQPTVQPSTQPSRQPSCQPSHQPSSIPTAQPSVQPSSQPSKQPTSQPSSQPSSAPSSQPTFRPTSSQPTSIPSAYPTKFPTTSHPTQEGDTNPPSFYPTSSPTWQLDDFSTSSIYTNHLANTAELRAEENSVVYSTFYYKGLTVDGTCDDWNDYTFKSLDPPFDDIIFNRIEARFEIFDFDTNTVSMDVAKCGDEERIGEMMEHIRSGSTENFEFPCNFRSWRVFTCAGSRVICVNCKETCVKTETCPGRSFTVSPCLDCLVHAAASAVISFKYEIQPLYPIIDYGIVAIEVGRTFLTVSVQIDRPGTATCASIPSGTAITAVSDVTSAGTPMLYSQIGMNRTHNMTNLAPNTEYIVYCATESLEGYGMVSIIDVITTNITLTTLCCKSFQFPDTQRIVPSTSSTSDIIEQQFLLDAAPISDITVRLSFEIADCAEGFVDGRPSIMELSTIAPNVFSFSSDSLFLGATYSLYGFEGCYDIVAMVNDGEEEYTSASTRINIVEASSLLVPAPVVDTVILNENALTISVFFDKDTSMPASTRAIETDGRFSCSELFDFTGIEFARCYWVTPSHLQIELSAISDVEEQSLLSPGDEIVIRSGRVQAFCFSTITDDDFCTSYPYTNTTVIILQDPIRPIIPIVGLSTSHFIVSCDSIYLDPTSSSGSGGRPWKSVKWSVSSNTAMNATTDAISDYLNSEYNDTTSVVRVPRRLLEDGVKTYSFQLELTNFLYQDSARSVNVIISDDSDEETIRVSIYGPRRRTIYRWQSLSLFGIAELPSCLSNDATSIRYIWSAFMGRVLDDSIVSVAANERFFTLDAYTLVPSAEYTIQLAVTSSNSSDNNPVLYTATTSVVVLQAGVVAVISGGNQHFISTSISGGSVSIDGGSSYDMDYPDASSSTLTFKWSCVQYNPNYGSSCPPVVNSVTESTTDAILVVTSAQVDPGVTYLITLQVSNSAGSSDQTTCLLAAQVEQAPLVSINNEDLPLKIVSSSKFLLTSTIVSSVADVEGNANWSSSLNASKFHDITLTPLSITFNNGTKFFQLAMAPNSFNPGASLTFQITAHYSNTPDTKAVAEVEVLVNQAPLGGLLSISPSSGEAIETVFEMVTSQWVDDAEDLPLSYWFRYYNTNKKFLFTLKEYNEVAGTSVVLGEGTSLNNYEVVCICTVRDIFGAESNTSNSVIVTPVSSFDLEALLVEEINNAIIRKNSEHVIQILNAGLQTVSSSKINCSVPIPCKNLNREECFGTQHTCGKCFEGYVGAFSDANLLCVDTSTSLKDIGDNCINDFDCITGICSNITFPSKCIDIQKPCPNDCSAAGTCQYFDAYGKLTMNCSVSNAHCFARCLCNNDAYGKDCSLTRIELEESQQIRYTICEQLNATSDLQEMTLQVIAAQVTLLSLVFNDIEQFNQLTFNSCTELIFLIIETYSEFICELNIQDLLLDILSNILDAPHSAVYDLLTDEVLIKIEEALSLISLTCQKKLAIGEQRVTYLRSNLRFMTALVSVNDINAKFQIDLPMIEQLKSNNDYGTSLTIDLFSIEENNINALGVILTEFTSNPQQYQENSSVVQIETYQYTSTDSGVILIDENERRQLFTGENIITSNNIGFTIVLENLQPINYNILHDSTIIVDCKEYKSSTYQRSTICPNGLQLTYECPAKEKGSFLLNCPGYSDKPECKELSSTSSLEGNEDSTSLNFIPSSNCHVITFDSFTTTCYCLGTTTTTTMRSRRRQLIDTTTSSLRTSQRFASGKIVKNGNFMDKFKKLPDRLKIHPIVIIWSSVLFTSIILIVGLVSLIRKDRDEEYQRKIKCAFNITSSRTIQSFFHIILPDACNLNSWKERYFYDLKKEHCWWKIFLLLQKEFFKKIKKWNIYFQYSWQQQQQQQELHSKSNIMNKNDMNYKEEENIDKIRWKIPEATLSYQWLLCGGKCISFLFSNTILAFIFYPDNGICEKYNNASSCNDSKGFLNLLSNCRWRPDSESCSFRPVEYHFITICIFLLISLFLTVILVRILVISLDIIERYASFRRIKTTLVHVQDPYDLKHNSGMLPTGMLPSAFDEMQAMQSLPVKLRLASRLWKMQSVGDRVLPSEEVENILFRLKNELPSFMKPSTKESISQQDNEITTNVPNGSGPLRETVSEMWHRTVRSETLRRMRHQMNITSRDGMYQFMRQVRMNAEQLRWELNTITDYQERDVYLMKMMVISCLPIESHAEAQQQLLGYHALPRKEHLQAVQYIAAYVILVLWFCTLITLTIYFQITIGSRATDYWILCVFLACICDALILQPIHILFRSWFFHASVRLEIRQICDILQRRYISIMHRNAGFMRDADAYIHHLNAACRVARHFPELPVSRLLISLNDFDIPVLSSQWSKALSYCSFFKQETLSPWLRMVLVQFPHFIYQRLLLVDINMKDLILEIFVVISVFLALIGLYICGRDIHAAVPVAIIIGIFLLCAAVDSAFVRKRLIPSLYGFFVVPPPRYPAGVLYEEAARQAKRKSSEEERPSTAVTDIFVAEIPRESLGLPPNDAMKDTTGSINDHQKQFTNVSSGNAITSHKLRENNESVQPAAGGAIDLVPVQVPPLSPQRSKVSQSSEQSEQDTPIENIHVDFSLAENAVTMPKLPAGSDPSIFVQDGDHLLDGDHNKRPTISRSSFRAVDDDESVLVSIQKQQHQKHAQEWNRRNAAMRSRRRLHQISTTSSSKVSDRQLRPLSPQLQRAGEESVRHQSIGFSVDTSEEKSMNDEKSVISGENLMQTIGRYRHHRREEQKDDNRKQLSNADINTRSVSSKEDSRRERLRDWDAAGNRDLAWGGAADGDDAIMGSISEWDRAREQFANAAARKNQTPTSNDSTRNKNGRENEVERQDSTIREHSSQHRLNNRSTSLLDAAVNNDSQDRRIRPSAQALMMNHLPPSIDNNDENLTINYYRNQELQELSQQSIYTQESSRTRNDPEDRQRRNRRSGGMSTGSRLRQVYERRSAEMDRVGPGPPKT